MQMQRRRYTRARFVCIHVEVQNANTPNIRRERERGGNNNYPVMHSSPGAHNFELGSRVVEIATHHYVPSSLYRRNSWHYAFICDRLLSIGSTVRAFSNPIGKVMVASLKEWDVELHRFPFVILYRDEIIFPSVEDLLISRVHYGRLF